jgi:hypothetical protein
MDQLISIFLFQLIPRLQYNFLQNLHHFHLQYENLIYFFILLKYEMRYVKLIAFSFYITA